MDVERDEHDGGGGGGNGGGDEQGQGQAGGAAAVVEAEVEAAPARRVCLIWHCVNEAEAGHHVCEQCARIRNVGWRALDRASRIYTHRGRAGVWDLIAANPDLAEALFAVHTAAIDRNPYKRVIGACTECDRFHPYLQVVRPESPPGTPPPSQPVTRYLCDGCVLHSHDVVPRDATNRPALGAVAAALVSQ